MTTESQQLRTHYFKLRLRLAYINVSGVTLAMLATQNKALKPG